MFDTGRTVDVFGMASRRRDATVERLADLPNNHEIVHRPGAQRAEQIRPGLRQMLLSCTKKLDEALPRIGRSKFAIGEAAELHGKFGSRELSHATIGHSIPKIHLISSGMILGFRCSTNAPHKKGLANERRAIAGKFCPLWQHGMSQCRPRLERTASAKTDSR